MPNTTPIKPTPSERRKAATLMMARSRQAFTDVCSGCSHKERHTREIVLPVSLDPTDPWQRILCNRAQANPLGSCVLLSVHIRSSHNQAESLHRRISDREVRDDGLQRASRAAMLEF